MQKEEKKCLKEEEKERKVLCFCLFSEIIDSRHYRLRISLLKTKCIYMWKLVLKTVYLIRGLNKQLYKKMEILINMSLQDEQE